MRAVLQRGDFSEGLLLHAFFLNVVYIVGASIFFNWMVRLARKRGLLAKLGTQ